MVFNFKGNIVMVGFGGVGQALLPVLINDFKISPDRIRVITADEKGYPVLQEYGIKGLVQPLVPENLDKTLRPHLNKGDFLVNVSVSVSSLELIRLCQEIGALYLDTCVEPWDGLYLNPDKHAADRTNYSLRQQAITKRKDYKNGPTAVIAHGANPGIISHFLKKALLILAQEQEMDTRMNTPESWAQLSHKLGVSVIHVAERDTQDAAICKDQGDFVNTWSIAGFISEGCQPAELGWGTHEKELPFDGHAHADPLASSIYLDSPGFLTRVRTWTPLYGPFYGNLVTHHESISLSDFLSLRDGQKVLYRPTVHYAYHPSDMTILSINEFCARNFEDPKSTHLLMDEITHGIDELGILLMGHGRNAFWYGSRLSIQEARQIAPHNNATTMQVVAGILAGMDYAIQNPHQGIVEAEDMDSERALKVAAPYLGEVAGAYSDWTPLKNRSSLQPGPLDKDDPWQFKNFRVA